MEVDNGCNSKNHGFYTQNLWDLFFFFFGGGWCNRGGNNLDLKKKKKKNPFSPSFRGLAVFLLISFA